MHAGDHVLRIVGILLILGGITVWVERHTSNHVTSSSWNERGER